MMNKYELHPLCTLFPRLSGSEFDALRAFSGARKDSPAIADFWADEEASGYWNFSICDVASHEQIKSQRPVAEEAVFLILDAFGGVDNWVLSPCDRPVIGGIKIEDRLDRITRKDEVVYFLRAGDFIKIGKATGSPKARIASMRTGCPFPITVLAYMPGGIKEEFSLHNRFSSIRAHGEWFHADAELVEFIESIEVPA